MPRILKHFTVTALLAVTLASAGCYGQFALTRKVYAWNGQATHSPIGNSAIMWGLIIIPVYPLASIADILIFNVIEVFDGRNPMAINDDGSGTWKKDGHDYRFSRTGAGAIEVQVDGVRAIRYRKQGDAVEIENLRGGTLHVLPIAKAHALARTGGTL